jgi:hypothetical protein
MPNQNTSQTVFTQFNSAVFTIQTVRLTVSVFSGIPVFFRQTICSITGK